MDLYESVSENLAQIARLALTGTVQDVQALIRQVTVKLWKLDPALAKRLADLLALSPTATTPLPDVEAAMVPIDADSRHPLVKHEFPVVMADELILEHDLRGRLEQVVNERKNLERLELRGLPPTRTILFVGPPGVGKTMSARWIAKELGRPLITLDLATVMSSFLGKTGSNIRSALDYAKSMESVLLLDEFDLIAKRRDDDGDVGELKRLVTLLIQEIDDWPFSSILIAETNHSELLDPAAWRRFDDVLEFLPPLTEGRRRAISSLFTEEDKVSHWIPVLVDLWDGKSISDISRAIQWVLRRSTIGEISVEDALIERVSRDLRAGSLQDRIRVAKLLESAGYSDRRTSQILKVSRDTIRRHRDVDSNIFRLIR